MCGGHLLAHLFQKLIQGLRRVFAKHVAKLRHKLIEAGVFTPLILPNGELLSHLASVDLEHGSDHRSIAFGVEGGWQAEWKAPLPNPVSLGAAGRFELSAMLTVANPGQPARFYRSDPEIVIGDDT